MFMKLKKDVKPLCHIFEGKRGAAMWGGTLRKNLGYKAIITFLAGLAAVFSVIALGIAAVGKSLSSAKSYAKNNPSKLKGFILAVAALNKIADYLVKEDE